MIAGNVFCIDSVLELRIEDSIRPFLGNEFSGDVVNIRVVADAPERPAPSGPMSGEDLLLEYYLQEDAVFCLSKGGSGYLSTAVCSPDYKNIVCYLHSTHAASLSSVGNLLRLIPMKTILQRSGTIFLHGSQIAFQGKGILFTAPSGTGKTTQAKLWKGNTGAQIICNDRVLIRGGQTYGYPVDGSEPVFSSASFPLGAVVVLEQSPENKVRQLKPREALARLMPQMVHDYWSSEATSAATQQILEMLQKFPVYLLECTPDERAVTCLRQQLKKDGVLQDG